MEADAAVRIAAGSTIFQVTFNGTTYLGKLATYLMVATCVQRYLKHEVAFTLCNKTIVKHSFLAVWHFAVISTGCVLLLVARQPMGKRFLKLRRLVCDNRQVSFLHSLMLGKHFVKSGQGLARFGKKHDTAHGTIQPVNDAKKDIAGLLVLLFEICLY